MINLEQEYGSFLDLLGSHLDSEELLHSGVKGMKWGVRKDRPSAPELKGLGPQSITRKTASGHEITISQDPPNALQKFLGRHSTKYREDFGRGAFLTIKDKDGHKVGDAIIEKRSKDELYLLWLGIKKKERGKGYATAVMKAAEEFGKKEGFKKLTLEVPGNAKDAAHIYNKLGFKVVRETVASTNNIWGGLTEMEYTFSDVKHADSKNLQVVVVAIPREDDYVWKISSEKVPHMTLLYLGEVNWSPEQVNHVTDYIQHASSMVSRFGMGVDHRGTLGADDADVLFFDKSWSFGKLEQFRSNLLIDRDINEAYLAASQYPEWTPHLTLGFPATPAKPDTRDYPVGWVEFDRIALWIADSEGPTFQLKSQPDFVNDAAWSAVPQDLDLDEVLEHYGVKGMKWGQRKKSRQTEPTHADSEQVGNIKSRVKTQKTTKILSNEEIRAAIDRMRIEQEFSKLSGGIDKTRVEKGKQFIGKLLVDTGKQNVEQTVKTQSQSFINEALKNAAKK